MAPKCPKLALPLTDIQVRNAKPARRRVQACGTAAGFYLEVNPSGSRICASAIPRQMGKKNRLTFGNYPAVSLAARVSGAPKRPNQQQLARGNDPAQARRVEKQLKAVTASNTFEAIAREWHAKKAESWKESTVEETSCTG